MDVAAVVAAAARGGLHVEDGLADNLCHCEKDLGVLHVDFF